MSAELQSRWFVAHTHPHAEAKATAHLNRQGFEIYFPRYLFVSIDINIQRWRSICSTVGISRLVCNGDDPIPVPMGIVEALRNREDPTGFIKLDCRPRFRAGDKIRVLEGAFSSCLGLFEGMAERERIAILLDLLGRKVRVVLDADLVAAA